MLRVVSYNIHKAVGTDRMRRPERILSVLDETDGDVIILQEADRRLGARAAALPRAMIHAHGRWKVAPLSIRPASMGWHGNALLIARDLAIRAVGRIDIPQLEPRGAVFAELECNGAHLRIVGMHLDLSGLRRVHQAEIIMHAIGHRRNMPTILAGDMNEWMRRGGCITAFSNHYHEVPLGPSFHARRPIAWLDRMFVSPGLHVRASGVHMSPLARTASDHLPVWADIDPRTARPAG